jgi:hypothetical protein
MLAASRETQGLRCPRRKPQHPIGQAARVEQFTRAGDPAVHLDVGIASVLRVESFDSFLKGIHPSKLPRACLLVKVNHKFTKLVLVSN